MLHIYFLNRYGVFYHKSPESYGGLIENIGDGVDVFEEGEVSNEAKDNTATSMIESELLPTEVESMSINQPGSSEHGTLISGEVEDPEVLRQRLKEMLEKKC